MAMPDPLPDELDEALWQEACRRADAIRTVLKGSVDQTSAADIADLSEELGLSRASVFRLIKQYRKSGSVISLVDRKRGRPTGHRALDAVREKIIHSAIKKYYLKQTRPTVSQLVRDIRTDCHVVGLKPPHRRTIEARLEDIDLRKRARRRGEGIVREN